jgi:phosphoglycolate phosphatase-like HAD superfamily hydrolase
MTSMLEFTRKHEFLVGIDSDGCAFDTMELKHKECFIPQIINHYGLQGVSKYAREAAEFVNLYSKSRGINRFPALIEALQWLEKRPEVQARGVRITIPQGLVEWIKVETKLANPALAKAVDARGHADLKQALAWSKAVNEAVEKMVRCVPPFPYVRQSLEKLKDKADLLVVSATPTEALKREWEEHDLAKYVVAIWGQEVGTKKEHLAVAKNYAPQHTLMIGDAPGDYQAAVANKALFFPINPGAEERSWKRLYDEGIAKFLDGSFADEYQEKLLAEFDSYLPERPPWEKA